MAVVQSCDCGRAGLGGVANCRNGLCAQGRVGSGLGSRLKARRQQQWVALGSARLHRLRAVAALEMCGYGSGGNGEAGLG